MTTNHEKRLSQEKKCPGAWMIALMALFPSALSADESVTSSAGGTGGNPYTVGCGTKAMVGVQGGGYRPGGLALYSTVVGFIQPICVDLNADGSWNGTPAPAQGVAGINRGTFTPLLCPQNQAVSGISGRSGIYVDQLRMHCAPLVEPGHLKDEGSLLANGFGGFDGSPFGAFVCPSNKPGKGFTGKAADWVDQVALVCDYPSTVAAPVVKTIALNATSVVGGTTVSGTVTLNANAPPAGTPVNLSMSVPSSATFQSNPVTVPSGTKTANFVVNTNPVSSNVTNSISATPNTGLLFAAVLTLKEPELAWLNVAPTKTSPGGSVTGQVSLNGKAFSGLAVSLASSDTAAATVPSAVTIPQNQPSVSFPLTVSSANLSGCSVISATYKQAGRKVLLNVSTSANPAFTLVISAISGSSVTATVGFPSSSNAARELSLVSSKPATASAPVKVTVPAGAPSADFTITMSPFLSTTVDCAVITAIDQAQHAANSVILNIADKSVTAIN